MKDYLVGIMAVCIGLFIVTLSEATIIHFEDTIATDTTLTIPNDTTSMVRERITLVELNHNFRAFRRAWKTGSDTQIITADLSDTKIAEITATFGSITCEEADTRADIIGINNNRKYIHSGH